MYLDVGVVTLLPGIQHLVNEDRIYEGHLDSILRNHSAGRWGMITEEDALHNEACVMDGNGMVLSVYFVNGYEIWTVTVVETKATAILLPEEFA